MADGGQSPEYQTPARESDPERIAATETTKQSFRSLVEQLAEGGRILRHGMSKDKTYDLEDGRHLTVRSRLPVDVRKLNPIEKLTYQSGDLTTVKLRREFNTGAREFEDYRLKPDFTFECEYDFLSPEDRPVSEMTEEESEKFGKELEESLQLKSLERELGMRIVTEAEAQNINALLQNVLSSKGTGGSAEGKPGQLPPPASQK